MSFVSITETIGLPADTPYDKLPWFSVDYASKFGLQDFSGA